METVPETKPSTPIREHFLASWPDAAVKALATVVAFNHLQSHEFATAKYGEVGVARSGLLRWIATDADIVRLVSHRFPGVSVHFVPNATNGSRHVEVVAGDFRLLVLHDLDEMSIVPKSDYGRTAAECNQG